MSVTAKSKAGRKADSSDGADPAEETRVSSPSASKKPRGAPVAEAGPELKKQELLEKLIGRADVQKKLAKPVLDAVLELLGEALAEGRDLNLPPLGKVKVNRVKDMAQARVIVAKIRQSKAESPASAETREMGAKVAVAEDPD